MSCVSLNWGRLVHGSKERVVRYVLRGVAALFALLIAAFLAFAVYVDLPAQVTRVHVDDGQADVQRGLRRRPR